MTRSYMNPDADYTPNDIGPSQNFETPQMAHAWSMDRQAIRDRWGPETEDDIIAERAKLEDMELDNL